MTEDNRNGNNALMAHIEDNFRAFATRSPSENVLQRVREMAHARVAPRSRRWQVILSAFFTARRLVFLTTAVLLVAFGLVSLNLSRDTANLNPSAIKASVNGKTHTRTEAHVKTSSSPEMLIWAQAEFDRALELFQAEKFEESQTAFAEIATRTPDFEKHREVYQYWIESLKKLGEYRAAEQRQRELEMERP